MDGALPNLNVLLTPEELARLDAAADALARSFREQVISDLKKKHVETSAVNVDVLSMYSMIRDMLGESPSEMDLYKELLKECRAKHPNATEEELTRRTKRDYYKCVIDLVRNGDARLSEVDWDQVLEKFCSPDADAKQVAEACCAQAIEAVLDQAPPEK